jgi:putative SOS response-associated peptidase YedK
MCYDISFTAPVEQEKVVFPDLNFDEEIFVTPEANTHIMGHTFGNHPIIYRNRDDLKLHCRLMEWGVIPFYIKDENAFLKQRASMLNARSERILEDEKSYWYKIRNRRCLIPITGIYEHRTIKGWKKKVPYYIQIKNALLIFLPGLYSVAELPNHSTGEIEKRYTFTLITRAGNKLMQQIHNDGDNAGRMPLFLPQELAQQWLQEDLNSEAYKIILNYELPSEQLNYLPVYTIRTSKKRPDGKLKNEVYKWKGLPEISL